MAQELAEFDSRSGGEGNASTVTHAVVRRLDDAVRPIGDQQRETAAPEVQPWWKLTIYGGPALALVLAEIPILLYLPAFYAQEVGLSVGFVGLAFATARIWNGLWDVLVGWLSDRTRSRFGRRKPWVVLGAPALMISTWFLCSPPEGAGVAYLMVWIALFYAADTIAKIPYLSWGTELATDYVGRSRVTAYRGIFYTLGSLFFVLAPLLFLSDTAPLSEVLFLVSLTVSMVVPVTVLLLGWFVSDPPPTTYVRSAVFKELGAIAKDGVMRNFCASVLMSSISNGVCNSLAVFAYTVGLQLPNKLFLAIFVLYLSTLCALPLASRLGKRAQKHRLWAIANLALVLAYLGHLVIPAGNFPLILMLWIVGSIGTATDQFLPTSILADIIDRSEVAVGARRSGAYMASYNLITKIGLALGVGLSFGLLGLVGYDPAAAHHSAADARNVLLLGFGLPALLSATASILMWRHSITREVQQQLRAAIDARKCAPTERS